MCGAIWSTSSDEVLKMPTKYILKFLDNHGLLNFSNRPNTPELVGAPIRREDPKNQNNNQNIADEVMDILMLEEKQEELEIPELVISEYDAGDVDLIELKNQNLENNSTKNVVVHDSFDDLEDHLKGAKIIGDISKEVSFDSEQKTH